MASEPSSQTTGTSNNKNLPASTSRNENVPASLSRNENVPASLSRNENVIYSPTLAVTPDLMSCYGSGSSTPEAQVEASLAYRGTERYGGKARQIRKMKAQLEKHGPKSDEEEEEEERAERDEEVEVSSGSTAEEEEEEEEEGGETQSLHIVFGDTLVRKNEDATLGANADKNDEVKIGECSSSAKKIERAPAQGILTEHVDKCVKMEGNKPTKEEPSVLNEPIEENCDELAQSSSLSSQEQKEEEEKEAFSIQIGDKSYVKQNAQDCIDSKCIQTELDGVELRNLLRNADSLDFHALKALVMRLREILLDKEDVLVVPKTVTLDLPAPPDEVLPDPIESESTKEEESDSEEDLRAVKSSFIAPSSSEDTDDAGGDRLSNTYSGRTLKAALKMRRISSAHAVGGSGGSLRRRRDTIVDKFQKQGAEQVPIQPEILKYVGERKEQLQVKPDLEQRSSERLALLRGTGGSVCQFCGQPINSAVKAGTGTYCCPEMEYFLKLSSQSGDKEEVVDEMIDINHKPTSANSKRKKAARQRAADRDREREMTRQRQQTQNMFAFVKQMKKIEFSLSSPKCMEEGWTIRPISPQLEPLEAEGSHITVEVNSTLLHTAGVLVERTYDSGSPFLTLFPDGTGCCYYPSGNVAVLISSPQKGNYSYIVQTDECYDDLYTDGGLLAFFEPSGDSVCYYNTNYSQQKIHTFINAHGGIELDAKGRRKKRWQWYQIRGHVHTPPFHPLCFSLNKYLAVRVHNQHNIVLTFSFGVHHVRFNVGAQVKVATCGRGGNFKGDPAEQHLLVMRRKINAVLGNMHGALRLPKSARDGKFPTPGQRRKATLAKKMASVVLPPVNHLPSLEGKLPVIIS